MILSSISQIQSTCFLTHMGGGVVCHGSPPRGSLWIPFTEFRLSESPSYRGGRGGSEELGIAVLVVSGLVWITGPFLTAGAGGGVGGFTPGVGPDALGAAAVGLGARFGAGGEEKMLNDQNTNLFKPNIIISAAEVNKQLNY